MPTRPTKAKSARFLIKFDLPTAIPPKLKIKPIAAMANDTQKTMFTQDVVQLRPSKVPDNNCVPKKMANAQLIRALNKDIVVFSVMFKNSIVIG